MLIQGSVAEPFQHFRAFECHYRFSHSKVSLKFLGSQLQVNFDTFLNAVSIDMQETMIFQ